MVTGASTADLAIVLVDAREGLLTQSRRHAAIAGLLGIPRIVLAVNKMDLVDYDQDVFRRICGDFRAWAVAPGRRGARLHPDLRAQGRQRRRALREPRLVRRADAAAVPRGGAGRRRRSPAGRCGCPVQWVVRDQETEHRGYAGQLAGGTVRRRRRGRRAAGRHARSRVSAIDAPSGAVDAAGAPLSIAVRLEDQLDVARGAMIAPRRRAAALGPRDRRDASAGSARPTACRAAATCSSTRRATVRAVLDTIHHTLEVEQLTERPDAD